MKRLLIVMLLLSACAFAQTTKKFPYVDGVPTVGHCAKWTGSGSLGDVACGGGGSSTGEISLADFGAHPNGDGNTYPSCGITSGTKTLVCAAVFANTDVGKNLLMKGAGVAGADLTTKIDAYVSATTVTLHDAASTTVSTVGLPNYHSGAYWGTSVDDTATFAAALAACKGDQTKAGQGGCTLKVPPGTYSLNATQVISLWNAANLSNRVTIECVGGYNTSRIVWTGLDTKAMFQVDDSTMKAPPVSIKNCGFAGIDSVHRPTPMQVVGGVSHEFSGNYVGPYAYNGVNWSQTWLGKIEFNYFYGTEVAIAFDNACNVFSNALGHGDVGCPVNGVTVANNHLGAYGTYGIWSHATGQGGTYENAYQNNIIEGTSTTTIADVSLNDSGSDWHGNYMENAGSSVVGYRQYIITGSLGTYNFGETLGCSTISGTDLVITATNIWSLCSGQTWAIDNTSSTNNTYIGHIAASAFKLPLEGRLSTYIGDLGITTWGFSTELDPTWTHGHVTISGTPFGTSNSAQTNPNRPNEFTTAATVPTGTIVTNRYAQYGVGTAPFGPGTTPQDGALFYYCKANPCTTNPATVATEWARAGELSNKIRQESWQVPTSGAWTVGDFFWNTNPLGSSPILGWVCTVAGTPGTWVAVYGGVGGTATIASGAKTLATSAIASATCAAAQTDTATGTASTDAIIVSFNGDPTAVTGYVPLTAGMLTIIPYPTTNTVNFKVCNNTSSSITPGAVTINWRVVR